MVTHRCKLPKELVPAVLRFSLENPQYGSFKGAFGMCFYASVDFQEILFAMGLISEEGRGRSWDVVKVWELADGEGLSPECTFHWVFKYHDVLIDWSARQFSASYSFPEVYRTEEWEAD